MMSLIIVVISIALSALVVFGGVSYYSHDTGIRTEVAIVVKANYETLQTAISNYEMANNGIKAQTLDNLLGYLHNGVPPVFPKYETTSQPFRWTLSSGKLCLSRSSSDEKFVAVDKGIFNFIEGLGRSQVHTIKVGTTCTLAADGNVTTISPTFNLPYLISSDNIAFVFEDN